MREQRDWFSILGWDIVQTKTEMGIISRPFYITRDELRVGRLFHGAYTNNTNSEAIVPTRDGVYIPCEGEETSKIGAFLGLVGVIQAPW